jgi:hypothetical protein
MPLMLILSKGRGGKLVSSETLDVVLCPIDQCKICLQCKLGCVIVHSRNVSDEFARESRSILAGYRCACECEERMTATDSRSRWALKWIIIRAWKRRSCPRLLAKHTFAPLKPQWGEWLAVNPPTADDLRHPHGNIDREQ